MVATGHVELALVVGAALFVGAVPTIFRYSRVIWMHFDHALDPHQGGEPPDPEPRDG